MLALFVMIPVTLFLLFAEYRLWFHGDSYMQGLRDAQDSLPDWFPLKRARYLEGPYFLWIMRFAFGLILIVGGYTTFAELQLLFH